MSQRKVNTTQNKENKLELKGVVVENLQDTNYLVEITYKGLKHKLSAYPSGKLRTYYRGKIMVGDEVMVEIDLPYIDLGRITRKLVKRREETQQQQ
jgi:translation initiation factor IF-1